MYDIDPAHSALRLGVNLQEVKSRHEERADIEHQIKALSLRWTELTMLIETEHAQSQPIRISGPFTDNDFWTHRHRVMGGFEPKVARADGQIEFLHEDDGA